jgi:hypothetical protein
MNRLFIRITIIILVLIIAFSACVNIDDNVPSLSSLSVSGSSDGGPAATATYGAEQFHIQLTAIAQPVP